MGARNLKARGGSVFRQMVVAVVFCAYAVTCVDLLQAPVYEASAKVRQENGAIATRPVVEEVIRRWDLKVTPAEFRDNLTVERIEGTNLARLAFEDTDNVRAVVNTLAKVSPAAALVEPAKVPFELASPHPWRNGLIALAVGLALVGVAKLAKLARS
jgi:hypothetical protein